MNSPFDDDTLASGEGSDTFFGNEENAHHGALGGVAGAFARPLDPNPASGTTAAASSIPISRNFPVGEDGTPDKNNVITARGTSEGLVLRIDGRVQPTDLLPAVRDFLNSRRSFLAGHDVAFEWVGKKADEVLIADLTAVLLNDFAVTVRSSRLKTAPAKGIDGNRQQDALPTTQPSPFVKSQSTPSASQPGNLSVVGSPSGINRSTSPISSSVEKTVSLFDGMEGYDAKMGGSGNAMLWDDPDARVIYGTLRSGQKIETEHSVVVFGDVNSGAEVIAGGDIIILGTLRGIAHAGAYDESGGGRVIFALNLQPTQLRIGLVISRGTSGDMRLGAAERAERNAGPNPEIARVDNNIIVVELYQSRTVWTRRRE